MTLAVVVALAVTETGIPMDEITDDMAVETTEETSVTEETTEETSVTDETTDETTERIA